ncbi:alpha-ketoglutarate-dependent dioxygenase AlkB [Methylomicrobium sp. RS1]|uniref:alpha-ketoglutarate-dependent dioxygenase AlkB n=1 Tax=Candidatus Methylomicrobium oryzae TaxID=2802053 RepID=UPI0019239C7B|nr:alpha-ketoglutarate-dependent dioxygenase AlkB [Methylomicrobium sp. RS1]
MIGQPNLCPFDGEIYGVKGFYRFPEADLLFDDFYRTLAWQEEAVLIFGKACKVPRLMCWYGDPEAIYRYSGVEHRPLPWTGELTEVRARIELCSGYAFNSVLANLYRDERDSMGYHADNEKELGINPAIASLSLGDSRLFRLRHKKRRENLDIVLEHGDLLVMAGTLQHHWVHALPKTRQVKHPRINLTFRLILPTAGR